MNKFLKELEQLMQDNQDTLVRLKEKDSDYYTAEQFVNTWGKWGKEEK